MNWLKSFIENKLKSMRAEKEKREKEFQLLREKQAKDLQLAREKRENELLIAKETNPAKKRLLQMPINPYKREVNSETLYNLEEVAQFVEQQGLNKALGGNFLREGYRQGGPVMRFMVYSEYANQSGEFVWINDYKDITRMSNTSWSISESRETRLD